MNAGDVPGVEPIAVIGMAGRFPGAGGSLAALWADLRAGVESVTRFGVPDLVAAGVPAALAADPDYVPAAAVIDGAELFDAAFFGYSPREAEITDPQHRVFLECAWAAFEDAGHDPRRFPGAAGVFAGAFLNKYLPQNLSQDPGFLASPYALLARVYNDKDFLATRVAYLLNLRGPAMTVQTACSTGLVAVHLACQSLWAYESDAALAGGVCLNVPLHAGYQTVDGGMFSPEGHCRPFDARARGTVPGYGAGAVLLRRLSDAVADRDHIRALIVGTAVNNDGSSKVGFTAPSVDAQAEVIMAAQAVAGVSPDSIGYVEAHGTGTQVGDPIEVAALSAAFAGATRRRFCALGSIKANIGHLDAAAGVAGLIRATLALEHREIPPNANFTEPNPELKLDGSPFYVPSEVTAWPPGPHPRRAGVTSLGIGGTNAHAVLQEAPAPPPPGPDRPWQLLPLSARDRTALASAADRLAGHLEDHPHARLADIAYTLQDGRHHFAERRFVVCRDTADAVTALRGRAASDAPALADPAQVVFMFPGGGTQHPDMGAELYDHEPVFRSEVDTAADLLAGRLGIDLRRFLFPSRFGGDGLDRDDVRFVLAGIFVIEYALARLWMSWGVAPLAMAGHSLGEYVAACLSGVFSLPDALELTVARGEIFARAPHGRMLAVALGEDDVTPLLGTRLSLAAVNAPALTLVSGPGDDVEALADRLDALGIDHRRVSIQLASHSWLMDPYLDEFRDRVARLSPRPPRIPFVSGVTGTWIRPGEATDPGYWSAHLRRPVRFADAIREASAAPGRVLLEVGPGHTLTTLARAQRIAPPPIAVPAMRHPRDTRSDHACMLTAAGTLWQAGVVLDWRALHGAAAPRRTPLPGYPFQRSRHWIGPGAPVTDPPAAPPDDPADRFAAPGTPREQMVAGLWAELLGVTRIGADDDFFALGGNSLMVTQLLRRLRQAGLPTLHPRDMFAAPTVAGLAAVLDDLTGGGHGDIGAVDLTAEVRLDESISAAHLPPRPAGPPRTVLLTGATGFLGLFLAAELLRRTPATVLCLVRAADPESGTARIRAHLTGSGLPVTGLERIVGVPGDLARPLLGLTRERFDELAAGVDAIYHAGAWVNFARPYRTLRDTNVGGVEELLRLATRTRLIPVHHVSTMAVLAGAFQDGVAEVLEDDPLPPPTGHDTGYSESKWVAEGVAHLARARGVPVSVYRPGVVLADSITGIMNAEDYLTKMVQGCVQLGVAPLRDYDQIYGTADHVARTVVALSLAAPDAGRTYHTVAERPLPWNRLFDAVRAFGYPVTSVPYRQWHDTLRAAVDRGEPNALAGLVDSLAVPGDRHTARVDRRNLLATAPGDEPVLDDAYFATMLRYGVRRGWLPPPPEGCR